MNGTRYLLDTNTVIAMIHGNEKTLRLTSGAAFVGISIISVLEFLSFGGITRKDKQLLLEIIKETEVVDLKMNDTALLNTISEIRPIYKLKLPDAIIAATAINKNATLISNDKHFQNINALSVLNF
jgi:tRNA(fMet)-specific endonuclease VapC